MTGTGSASRSIRRSSAEILDSNACVGRPSNPLRRPSAPELALRAEHLTLVVLEAGEARIAPGEDRLGGKACRARRALELTGEAYKDFCRLLPQLVRVFIANDLSLLEINPLVVTTDNRVLPLDCKMSVDDNALYRQPAVSAMRSLTSPR